MSASLTTTTSTNSTTSADEPHRAGVSLDSLPKSWHFTHSLPADAAYPTPADSHNAPRSALGPRQVRNALFTWVRPEPQTSPELLAVSPAAMRDLGLRAGEEHTDDFRQLVAGNKLYGWDEGREGRQAGGYPWAQCYGGFQFGQWAGQLGDGRAISLFEATSPGSGVRYELQLKGAGLTPYSRFADGKAVLRSSIREFVVSEALHALGIPSTRALALTLLPESNVLRERLEPGAIVLRFAQSWLRFGNFDILRARGDRQLIRRLATYIAEDVLGGWETLPGRLERPDAPQECCAAPRRGVSEKEVEGPEDVAENRFTRLYREIARRNAVTTAYWQAYGFMNGVLNTDNTSIFGLSIDFGPFAFMDNFDPSYTPNHDDGLLRYSYKNQPTVIWWNLVRLGEALGELIGMGADVDDETFIKEGVKEEAQEKSLAERAEKLILQAGEEYKATFLAEYKRLTAARLGLRRVKDSDFQDLFSESLDAMSELELDFHHFFRRLGGLRLSQLADREARRAAAGVFFHKEGPPVAVGEDNARERIALWLEKWRLRVIEDWRNDNDDDDDNDDNDDDDDDDAAVSYSISEERDGERQQAMKRVNPNFVARGWILDEVIRRVEKQGERAVLDRVMHMALHPFEDSWDGVKVDADGAAWKGDREEEQRWVGDVPRFERAMQCSCSS